jgi:hypothetical protein
MNEDDRTVQAWVKHRMKRQAIITRKGGPRLVAIMTEHGLRQPVGGPQVMADQVYKLIDLADRDNVTVRVIPQSVPTHVGLAGQFSILDFPSQPTLVFVEAMTTGLYRDDPVEVVRYRVAAEKLTAAALDKAGSVELLRSIARDLDGA